MNGSVPRVSVIMGVYNCASFLDDTVQSVVGQTFQDWELVLVDDGSTDQTSSRADDWAARDPRIRVFHQEHTGLPAASRNHGIREARGQIITFLDGDDLYHPDRIRRQVAILDACPEVGGVFHDFRWFANGSNPDRGLAFLSRDNYVQRAGDYLSPRSIEGETVWVGSGDLIKFMSSETVGIHTSAIAVRREVIDALSPPGFREDLPHCEDIDMWLRIARETRLAVLPVPLSYYRHNAAGWMATRDLRLRMSGSFMVKREMLERLERSLGPEEWPQYRDKVAERWRGVAYPRLIAGFMGPARFAYRQAFRTAGRVSGKLLAIKGLLVSLLPRAVRRAYWRVTGGGEFAERPGPPE